MKKFYLFTLFLFAFSIANSQVQVLSDYSPFKGNNLKSASPGLIKPSEKSLISESANSINALIIYSDGNDGLANNFKNNLLAIGGFDSIGVFNYYNVVTNEPNPISIEDVEYFDAVFIYVNYGWYGNQWVTLKEVLQNYLENGGGVVTGGITNYSAWNINFDDEYSVVGNALTYYWFNSSFGTIYDAGHPILKDVPNVQINTLYHYGASINPASTIIAKWFNGEPAVTVRENIGINKARSADLNLWPLDGGYQDSNTLKLIANALLWVARAESFTYPNDEGLCSAVVTYTVPLPNDTAIVITQIDESGLSSGDVFPVGSTLQEYQIDLGEGTLDTVSFTVIVEDTELPELTCQDFSVELNENDSAIVTLNDLLLSYSDNCGIDTMYMDMDTIVTCAQVGENIVTITVVDIHGNIATCQSTVTVIDNVPPTLICPEDIVVSNDPGECGAIVDYSTLVGEDLPERVSGDEILVDEVLPGSLSDWEIYDHWNNPAFYYEEITSPYDATTAIKTRAVGNTYSWCSTESLTKIYIINGNTDITKLKAYLEFASNLTTYNFPFITVEIQDNDGGNLGYQHYYGKEIYGSWYTSIIAGNPNYYTELPSASGDMILDLSKIGENIDFAKISIKLSNYTCIGENSIIFDHLRVINGNLDDGTDNTGLVASDNCPGVVVEADIPSGSFFPIGTTPVTLTATDKSGNTSTCSFTVTVTDTTAPVVSIEPLTVYLRGDGFYAFTDDENEQLFSGISDNCSSFEDLDIQVSPNMFNCFHVGNTWPLQVTVSDLAGNTTVVNTSVTVLDTTPPVALCRDLELFLDNKGEVYISPEMVETDTWNTIPLGGDISVFTRGSYDACGIVSMSVDKIKFTCSDLGENIVTLTVTDRNGNTSTCTSTVTIKDNIAPVITEVANIEIEVLPGVCETAIEYPDIVASDNCNVTLEQTEGLGADEMFPVGTTTETWVATDAEGNTSTVSFTVTVVTTNALPEMDEIADVVVDEDTPSVLVDLAGISHGIDCEDQELTITAETDNEALVTMLTVNYTSGNPTGTLAIGIAPDMSGAAEITVTVEDSEGGMVTKAFTLTVNPVNDAPFLVTPVADQTVHASYVLKVPISSVLGVMFDDIDDDELTISVVAEGTNSLPAWATYANDTLIFQPAITDTSCVNIVVTATDSSGATASDTFSICVDGYPVSIGDIEANRFGVRMYPNPTNGLVNLELSSGTYEMELSVMDIAGRTVLRKSYTASERISFDMSGKPAGMYFVKMNIEGKQIVEKLIVKD